MRRATYKNLSEASNALSLAWDRQAVVVVGLVIVVILLALNYAVQGLWLVALPGAIAFVFLTIIILAFRLFSGLTLVRPRWQWATLSALVLATMYATNAWVFDLFEFKQSGLYSWLYDYSILNYGLIIPHRHFLLLNALIIAMCFPLLIFAAQGTLLRLEDRGRKRRHELSATVPVQSISADDLIAADSEIVSARKASIRLWRLGLFRGLQISLRMLVLLALMLIPVAAAFAGLWHFGSDIFEIGEGKLKFNALAVLSSLPLFLVYAGLYFAGVLVMISALHLSANRVENADLDYYLNRQSYAAAQNVDRRQPILFLRSFKDDNLSVERKGIFWRMSGRDVRLEEVVTRVLSRVGVPVAIDPVGKKAMLRGAFRIFHTDDTWQEAFHSILAQCQLIVLIPGSTKGLSWEINQIVLKGAINRLIIIIPPGSTQERETKWQALLGMLEGTPVQDSLRATELNGLLALCFSSVEPQPICITGLCSNQMDYELAIVAAEREIWSAMPKETPLDI